MKKQKIINFAIIYFINFLRCKKKKKKTNKRKENFCLKFGIFFFFSTKIYSVQKVPKYTFTILYIKLIKAY